MSYVEVPEEEFRKALSKGDENAWNCFHTRYTHRMIRYALVILKDIDVATDLVQSVSLNLVRNRKRLVDIQDWEAYLFSALRRELWRYQKDSVRRSAFNSDYRRTLIHTAGHHEGGYVGKTDSNLEVKERVALALDQLTDEQREPIELRFFGELTFQQIADLLNLPFGTVVSRYRSGLVLLRKHLGEE